MQELSDKDYKLRKEIPLLTVVGVGCGGECCSPKANYQDEGFR